MVPCTPDNKKIEVDQCTNCGGIWFDGGELETLLGALAKKKLKPAGKTELTSRACPRCRCAMLSFNYPQTYAKIEFCEKCHGIWLDEREYDGIYHVRRKFMLSGDLNKPEKPTGVKGAIIDFINESIDSFLENFR